MGSRLLSRGAASILLCTLHTGSAGHSPSVSVIFHPSVSTFYPGPIAATLPGRRPPLGAAEGHLPTEAVACRGPQRPQGRHGGSPGRRLLRIRAGGRAGLCPRMRKAGRPPNPRPGRPARGQAAKLRTGPVRGPGGSQCGPSGVQVRGRAARAATHARSRHAPELPRPGPAVILRPPRRGS